jgi:hypothetical protein
MERNNTQNNTKHNIEIEIYKTKKKQNEYIKNIKKLIRT